MGLGKVGLMLSKISANPKVTFNLDVLNKQRGLLVVGLNVI